VNVKPSVMDKSPAGPDGQAVQRAFLVLAGLGIIIIVYFAIKFAWYVKLKLFYVDSKYSCPLWNFSCKFRETFESE